MAEKPVSGGLRVFLGFVFWSVILFEKTLQLSPYTIWLIALPIQIGCGAPIHKESWRSLQNGQMNMALWVSMSSWAAFFLSTVAIFAPKFLPASQHHHWLSAAASLIVLSLLGGRLEAPLRDWTKGALQRLWRRVPKTARVLRDNSAENLPLEQVVLGDRVLVKPGEQVPLDGQVLEGVSSVDESLWTGISVSVEKSPGSRIHGGTLNKGANLIFSVTRVPSEIALSQVMRAVEQSLSAKISTFTFADNYARNLIPAVFLVAVCSGIVLSWRGPEPRISHALTALTLVVIVSCPWVWSFARPLAIVAGMRRAARIGMKIRNPDMFETLQSPDVLLIDKTGILTQGQPEVREIIPFGGWTRESLARFALAAESRSQHPLAQALRRWASASGMEAPNYVLEAFEAFPGQGVSSVLDTRRVLIGSLSWLADHGIEPNPQSALNLQGKMDSLVGVAVDGKFVGAIVFSDQIRPEVREIVLELEAMGIEPILASGDRNATAYRAAEQAGIGGVYAETLSQDKVRIIAQLQSMGKRVSVVGEGCRDAQALSRADLALALSRRSWPERPHFSESEDGMDVAAEASDIVLMQRDLRAVLNAIRLGLRISRTIRENLWLVFAFHLAWIPMAAGLDLVAQGAFLNPAYFTVAPILGFITILLNSGRLLYSRRV